MLYREIIAVCSEIHTKHINTLCRQNAEFVNVQLAVHKTLSLFSLILFVNNNNIVQEQREISASVIERVKHSWRRTTSTHGFSQYVGQPTVSQLQPAPPAKCCSFM